MKVFDAQMSLQEGTYQRDVGRLFLLLKEGIDLVSASTFQAGQGDYPSEEEQEEMHRASKRLEYVSRELVLALTGRTIKFTSPMKGF